MARGQPESRLYASNVMDGGKRLDESKRKRIEAELLDDLATALGAAPKISEIALTDDERKAPNHDQLTAPVDTLSAENWDDAYLMAFDAWATAVPGRRGLRDAVDQLLTNLKLEDVTGLKRQTANDLDAEVGALMLLAIDLTPSLTDGKTICFKTPGDPCRDRGEIANRPRVATVLREFIGEPWRLDSIKKQLDKYYGDRGLAAVISVSNSMSPRRIDIAESDYVTRILWSKSLDATPTVVEEFLSVLLSRRDFGYFVGHPGLVSDFSVADQLALSQLNYRFNAAPASSLDSPAPLYNFLLFPPQQAALDGLGLILTVQKQTEGIGLVVQPKSASGAAERPASAPVSSTPQPAVQGTARPTPPPAMPPRSVPPTPATPDARPQPPRDQPRFIGGGVYYRPGQSGKPFVQFQQSNLNVGSAVASLSGQVGSNGEALGSGSGRVDYLWFKSLRHRLSAEFSGGTDFTQHRLIAGAAADERRTGGSTRVEFDALGGNNDGHLTLAAEGRRTSISLTPVNPAAGPVTLEGLGLSATYALQNLVSAHPFHLTIEPSVRFSWGSSPAVSDFRAAGIAASLNQHIADRVLTTFDLSVRLQAATGATPLVEQPSLGGAETLRGFRTDDVIGTSLWSIQPEAWFAFGRVFGRTKVADFVEKNLRLAGFVDVGGAYGVLAPDTDGVRWGPGIGIRFFQGPIALKVDWARGIGDGASGPGRGRFYVGVSTARTF